MRGCYSKAALPMLRVTDSHRLQCSQNAAGISKEREVPNLISFWIYTQYMELSCYLSYIAELLIKWKYAQDIQ